MRRSRSYTQRLVAILVLYLFIVAFVTYKNNWATQNLDQSSLVASGGEDVQEEKGLVKVPEDGEVYRIIGDEETLPVQISNGTSTGFKGEQKIILVSGSSEFSQQHLGGCPDWNCRMTTDQSVINQSHAVIYYGGAYGAPKVRHPWQYYVFFTQESPMHSSASAPYPNFYNLTLGYRRDSDAPCPYGYSIHRKNTKITSLDYFNTMVNNKTKLAAWFVSNCGAPSGRSHLVQELQKYIQVDVYGGCGTMSCPKGQACSDMLERDYKFYFAFENSICKDYMTEKFWERMTMNVVVVVLKRAVVEPYVPPNSFIAADDFKSVKEMADYLLKLNNDNNMYLNYFKWKLNYEAVYLDGRVHDIRERPWGFCRLCKLLWAVPLKYKSYPDAQRWWNEEAKCDHDLVNRLVKNSP